MATKIRRQFPLLVWFNGACGTFQSKERGEVMGHIRVTWTPMGSWMEQKSIDFPEELLKGPFDVDENTKMSYDEVYYILHGPHVKIINREIENIALKLAEEIEKRESIETSKLITEKLASKPIEEQVNIKFEQLRKLMRFKHLDEEENKRKGPIGDEE